MRRTSALVGVDARRVQLSQGVVTLVDVEQDCGPAGFRFRCAKGVSRVAELIVGVGSEAQLHDFAGGVASDEFTRWTLRHDGAMIHHDESIAQLLGLVHVVGW